MTSDPGLSVLRPAPVHERSWAESIQCRGGEDIVLEPSPAERAAADAYSALCDQIVRAINHDLRTPLTSLLCHTELLLATEGLPMSAQHSLGAMSRAGQTIKDRLGELTLTLGGPRRPSAGRVQVNIRTLLRGVAGQIGSMQSGSGVTLMVTCAEDLVLVVDATLIRRAMVELLHNALSSAPQGSTVELSVRVEADEICLEVRDEGPGLCVTDRERLVAALAAGAASGRRQAAGLGLAIASSVAAAHGGRVVLTNLPDGGFCASLHLDRHIVADT